MTIDGLPFSEELKAKLKVCDFEVQQIVINLCAEISKLQKQNLKLEVKNAVLNEGVKALREELREQTEKVKRFRENPFAVFLELSPEEREEYKKKLRHRMEEGDTQ